MTSLGFGPSAHMGGILPDAVVTQTANADTSSNTNTPTFSTQSIGTAANDRLVVVGIMSGGSSVVTDIACTIGGNAATIIEERFNSAGGSSAIAYLLVPTGTTADVVVTFTSGGTVARSAISVYSVTGLASFTPISTNGAVNDVAGTGAITAAVDTHPGGVVIAFAQTPETNSTWTWSGVTENNDTLISGEAGSYSGASVVSAMGGSITASATNATSSTKSLSVGSWR